MKRLVRTVVLASIVASLIATPQVHADPIDEFIPDQSSLDAYPNLNPSQGNWSDLDGGVTGRPYIAELSVTTGGVTTTLVTGGTTTTVASTTPGAITAVIAPINLCAEGRTSMCYDTPNRVSIQLAYVKGDGQLGGNFSAPTTALIPSITDTSVFDLTVGLNSIGGNLRWTWMSGAPTFWKTRGLRSDSGTARVKFSLGKYPSLNYSGPGAEMCSAIPVTVCNAEQSTQDTLGMQMILSLDTTLSEAFAGALFATNNAVMGSLDVSSGETPSLTYGIAGPHKMSDGSVRRGTFYGFLSDTILESQFKIVSTETDMTNILSIARTAASSSTSDAGTDTVTWSKWTADANGTDGRLVTISDISFSAPKFKVTKVPLTLSSKKATTFKAIALYAGLSVPTGATVTAVVASTSKSICRVIGTTIKGTKKGTCRVTVTVKPKTGSKKVRTVSLTVKS